VKYLIVMGRERHEYGDSFILAEPLTAEFCDLILSRAARFAVAAAHDDPPSRMTFPDSSDFWEAVEVRPVGASAGQEEWIDAMGLLELEDEPCLLVDGVREQREPEAAVRDVSMVVDQHHCWWEGYQQHSEVNIESEMVPLTQVRKWREQRGAGGSEDGR
jgi:hypothetical protein